MEQITHIYDKLFKKVLTLSPTAVINLINGLFGTDYPTDSKITYNWTELTTPELSKVLADTIITINDKASYHTEAQMTKDGEIIFRMFEYGYRHADLNREMHFEGNEGWMHFPEQRIIYLYSRGRIPDEYTLWLDFGAQGIFPYKVPVVKLSDISTEELNERKMAVLLPFLLLKVRDAIHKERSPENILALKNLLLNDIIGSIRENWKAGILTADDAAQLDHYTKKLYDHLYSQYVEKGELEDLTDHSFMTEVDIMVEEHHAKVAELEKQIADSKAKAEQERREKELIREEAKNARREKESILAENARLRALLLENGLIGN